MAKGFFGNIDFKDLPKLFEDEDGVKHRTAQNIDFKWLYTEEEIGKRKGINKAFYKEAGQILQQYMENYVPKREGDLASYSQVFARSDGAKVNYQKSYAAAQYYGLDRYGRKHADPNAVDNGALNEPVSWNRFTDNTTSYWDKAAWYYSKDLITRDFDNARKRHSHD